ncbi:MAG: FAD-binding oxidoreductase [Trueperaceae bacterium]
MSIPEDPKVHVAPAPLPARALLPTNEDYDRACLGFNLALTKRPQMVVMARNTDDVAAAVKHAGAAGMKVSVQATGHGGGVQVTDGLLVNTSRMQSLTVDPHAMTARVGAGVMWREVIEAAAPYGLAPLNGSSPSVGVVGLTLGGGMGPMGRTFGFAADHVLRLRLVTAEGAVIEVDAEHEPELFWALRGGKCSVGIVTELEFALMEVADYYGGAIFYPGSAAEAVLNAFGPWAATLPQQASTSLALLRLPDWDEVPEPLRGRLSLSLRYVFVGDDESGAALLGPMRAAASPLFDLVARTPYTAIGSVHQDPEGPLPGWDRGQLLRELPPEAVETLLAAAGPGVDLPLIMVEVRMMGGALARPPQVPNAVGGRHAAFSLEVVGACPPPMKEAVTAAGNAVLAALEPWSTGGTLINFQGDATSPQAVSHAWPEPTWARLQELKHRRDPEGRFAFGYPA